MSNDTPATGNGEPGPGEVAAARRVDNRTLWEQVRDRLREDILSGELAPGACSARPRWRSRSGSAAGRSARRSGGSRATAWSRPPPPGRDRRRADHGRVRRGLPASRGPGDARDPAGGAPARGERSDPPARAAPGDGRARRARRGERVLQRERRVPRPLRDGVREPQAAGDVPPADGPDGPLSGAIAGAARQHRPLGRRARGDPRGRRGRRRGTRRGPDGRPHRGPAARRDRDRRTCGGDRHIDHERRRER